MQRGPKWRSLSVADYEDGVQAILDKYGYDLITVRTMARAMDTLLDCKIEIAIYLRTLGVSCSQIGRLLNCGEWLARYYCAPNYRQWRMAQYRERMRNRSRERVEQKTSPPYHIERMQAAGPEVESVI